MFNKLLTLALLALPLSLATACGPELDTELDELSEQEQIIENLIAFGYAADDLDIDDQGRVVAQGDMIVSLESSEELVAGLADGEGFRQYRFTNLVDTYGGQRTLSVIGYTGASQGLDQTTQAALQTVIDEYNRLGLDIRFSLSFADSTNADIVVRHSSDGSGGWANPPSGGDPGPQIMLEGPVSTWPADVLRHVIKHELGHTLGLHHADYYDRSISCSQLTGPDQGATPHHIPGTPTTAWAHGSVMNACADGDSNGHFTLGDHAALRQLYGSTLAPAGGWCTHYGAELHRADFDGDGATDLLCHDTGTGYKWIDYAADGIDGTDWELSTGYCSHYGAELYVGDFDGDGRGDWLCTDGSGQRWIDLAANGFGNVENYWQDNWCTHWGAVFTVADLDSDGRSDLGCRNPDWSYAWHDYASTGFGNTDWHGQ